MMAWDKFGNPSALGAVTGMVAGYGMITPASDFVGSTGTLSIDINSGVMRHYVMCVIQQAFNIDDSLIIVLIRGVGGILRTVCADNFAYDHLGVLRRRGY